MPGKPAWNRRKECPRAATVPHRGRAGVVRPVHHGDQLYWLDHGYPRHKVGIEYDGEESHDSPDHVEADAIRRQWLTDHGWTIIVVRKSDFTRERREVWLRQVRAALGFF